MIFDESTVISVPRGLPDLVNMEFDLKEILQAEKRKQEAAYVNRDTAQELMHTFNEAYCSVFKIITKISLEYQKAQQEINKRKAIVLLDIAPEELKRRNLVTAKSPGGSEDLRTAVLSLDDKYNALLDRADAIKAFLNFMKIKAKGFEMSYQSVKKVYDSRNMPDGNHNLRAGDDTFEGTIGDPKFEF